MRLLEKFYRKEKELYSKSFFALLIRVFGLLSNYSLLVLVSSTLGVGSWGEYILCFTIIQIVANFSTRGYAQSLVKMIAEHPSNRFAFIKLVFRKLFWVNIFCSVLIFGLSYLTEFIFEGGSDLVMPIRIISFGLLPFSYVQVCSGIFRGLKMTSVYNLLDNLGRPLLILLSLSIMYFLNLVSETTIFYLFVIVYFSLLIVSSIYLLKVVGKGGLEINDDDYKKFASVSNALILTNIVNKGGNWFAILLLGVFVSNELTGVFDTCLRIVNLTTIILYAVNSISAAQFAELYKTSIERLQKNIDHSSALIFWFSVPLIFFMILFPELILGFFGDEFKIGKWPLVILLVGQLINNCSGSIGVLMQMIGYHNQFRNIAIISLLLNLTFSLSLIPGIDIMGAALAVSISLGFRNLVSVILIKKNAKLRSYYSPKFLRT